MNRYSKSNIIFTFRSPHVQHSLASDELNHILFSLFSSYPHLLSNSPWWFNFAFTFQSSSHFCKRLRAGVHIWINTAPWLSCKGLWVGCFTIAHSSIPKRWEAHQSPHPPPPTTNVPCAQHSAWHIACERLNVGYQYYVSNGGNQHLTLQ